MPLIKSLAAAGDLKLWHDYRAGHCANQVGYSGGAFDGVVAGAAGRFRTGVGYETSHNGLGSPTNLLVDGDMEAAGVGDWSVYGAVLTKELGTPHGGTQCLRATNDGVQVFTVANQACLTIGKTYLVCGWARSDGTQLPIVWDNGAPWWTGTNSTSWQPFSVVKVPTVTGIQFGAATPAHAGTEYVEWDDITVTELSLSNGYIRVADNASFVPPAGGMCLVASYMQTDASDDCQVIGQGADLATNTSWQLKRTATQIQFTTSDNTNLSTFAYAINAVPGQIETVTVRYTGGVGANNCTISVLAPAVSASTGQITAVPQNVAQPVSIGSYSTSTAYPFFGTMRYVAYVRGAQTAVSLAALAAELEAIDWPSETRLADGSGSVADRAVQYMSKFGVDCSIANESLAIKQELSNSAWVGGSDGIGDGAWRVVTQHTQNAGAGGPADVVKGFRSGARDEKPLFLPISRWAPGTTPTLAAYGTWDFWLYRADLANSMGTYVVYTLNGVNHDGYAVALAGTDLMLVVVSGGVTTPLVVVAGAVPTIGLIHIRVTRSATNVWKLYYQFVGVGEVAGPWIYGGTATDATIIVSEGITLRTNELGDVYIIGNHRSEKALFKWRGVVNPL